MGSVNVDAFRCIICLHDFCQARLGLVSFQRRRRLRLLEHPHVWKTCACGIRRRERAFERAKKLRLTGLIRDSIDNLISSNYIDYEINHIVLVSGEQLGSDFHEELSAAVENRIRSESTLNESWYVDYLDS